MRAVEQGSICWLYMSPDRCERYAALCCAALQGEAVVKAPLSVDGQEWLMTCVSMGNPHAVTYGTTTNSNLKVGRGGPEGGMHFMGGRRASEGSHLLTPCNS